jgi:PAS domain S-box-containing protein
MTTSPDFLQALVEASPVAMVVVDLAGRVQVWNPAAEQLFGWPAAEALGRFAPHVLPEQQAEFLTWLAGDGQAHSQRRDVWRLRNDGSRLRLRLLTAPIRDAQGRIRGVLGMHTDLAEQALAEAELDRQRRLLQTIIDNIPVMIAFFDPSGRFMLVNREWERVLGWDLATMNAQPDMMALFYPDPAYRRAALDYMQAGTAEWRAFTERLHLEERLLQSQKMESIGRLAGGIAHDFNNLLVPIIGYVDLSLSSLAPDDKLYVDLQQVRRAAERAADLTRQILAFGRRQLLEMRLLDLNDLVRNFQQLIHRLIGEDILLQTMLDPALMRVRADPGQIEQVLLNLVVNARDAMPNGGALTIETANIYLDSQYLAAYADEQAPGPYVLLAVSDTGHGMDAATRNLIFEPFFTTKAVGKGTGLGLSTVFGVVKQHQGLIRVYSEPQQGATFKIYLPQAVEAKHVPPEPSATSPLAGAETLLVVEDDAMVRQLICESLLAYGYDVLQAVDATDALRRAAAHPDSIQLLLTDVIMPGMNGRELYQRLLALRSDLRVLYMSGYTDDTIVRHGLLEAGIDYLQKPFTVTDLARKVRQVLER